MGGRSSDGGAGEKFGTNSFGHFRIITGSESFQRIMMLSHYDVVSVTPSAVYNECMCFRAGTPKCPHYTRITYGRRQSNSKKLKKHKL